ncbi:MAG: hypothetical protein WCN86_02715 [bacterium]
MNRKRWLLSSESERLISEFLDNWAVHWPETAKYNTFEMVIIKDYLANKVTDKYPSSGDVGFSRTDLKAAVGHLATLSQEKVKKGNPEPGLSSQCFDFVNLFLAHWDRRDKYSAGELANIRTILYSSVHDNYGKTKYMHLSVRPKDLKDAENFVNKNRRRAEVESLADARDARIRKARARYGKAAVPTHVLLYPNGRE